MPGPYRGFPRQHHEFLTNAADQLVMIAPEQVGTADAAAEQHIPAYQQALSFRIQAYAARGMAGHMQHGNSGIPEWDRFTILNIRVRFRRIFNHKTKQAGNLCSCYGAGRGHRGA